MRYFNIRTARYVCNKTARDFQPLDLRHGGTTMSTSMLQLLKQATTTNDHKLAIDDHKPPQTTSKQPQMTTNDHKPPTNDYELPTNER